MLVVASRAKMSASRMNSTLKTHYSFKFHCCSSKVGFGKYIIPVSIFDEPCSWPPIQGFYSVLIGHSKKCFICLNFHYRPRQMCFNGV